MRYEARSLNFITVSFLRGINDSHTGGVDRAARATGAHHEERRSTRSTRLGIGTLACGSCDAPVALAGPLSPGDELTCPFCRHSAPARGFLSLALPTRPARVVVRVVERVAQRRV
jgi:hypothetical protein